MVLTILFDLSRIASLGAIFYIVMDIVVQWGVFRHLRDEIGASTAVVGGAIVLDVVVLGAFVALKAQSDPMVIWFSVAGMVAIFGGERLFLNRPA